MNEHDELDTIRAKWFQRREQMEADADRCCEIFGIDPRYATDERDIAASIVLSGATKEDVIRQLERIRTKHLMSVDTKERTDKMSEIVEQVKEATHTPTDAVTSVKIEIACVEMVIENEIKRGSNQRQIAQTYALGIQSSWPTDWAKVNAMIVERWPKGLERIKKMAWSGKCFETKD